MAAPARQQLAICLPCLSGGTQLTLRLTRNEQVQQLSRSVRRQQTKQQRQLCAKCMVKEGDGWPSALTLLSLPVVPSLAADSTVPTWVPLIVAALGLGGIVAWRAALYVQLQYVTAAMLSRYVPKGGARIMQIGGGTRELFYYPKDAVLVVHVEEKANRGMMERGGVQAGIPVNVRLQNPTDLSFQGGSSIDAVVVLDALSSMTQMDMFLKELLRVLKPGCHAIFIERVRADGPAALLQGILGRPGAGVGDAVLDQIASTQGFSTVNWDLALQGQDPHVVGVATKRELDGDEEVEGIRAVLSSRSKRKKKK